jgi:epoxide hydrolase-like predicted phosphatase
VSDPSIVISDFGGVLTTPLDAAFMHAQDGLGVPLEAYGVAMAASAGRDGVNPLYALERGDITEAEFLVRMERGLAEALGRPVSLEGFGERLMGALEPNEPVFSYLRSLRRRGVRLALLTNNVREWEPHWRAMLPIDEVFEVIVDSGFVGMRKPERGIYELTLSRLGLPAAACAFVDDLEVNVDAARDVGMHGIVYRDADQAIAAIEGLLG